MSKSRTLRRALFRIAVILAVPAGLLFGSILLDQIPMAAARPPKGLKNIEEFRAWKGVAIKGEGTFQHAGVTYTVMLGPAGRYLASGPSAYLFDVNGQFVDWTADMGDFYTVRNGFNLTQGHVKNIERRKH